MATLSVNVPLTNGGGGADGAATQNAPPPKSATTTTTPPAAAWTPPASWAHYDTKTSPFLDLGMPFTAYEALKLVIFAPLLVLRCAVALAACTVLACFSAAASAGHPSMDTPFPPWRRRLAVTGSKLAGVVLWALGFQVRVEGRENIAAASALRCVALFNHVSWADAALVMYLLAASGVSRASNAHIPLIGTCIRAFQNIYIERTAGGGSAGGGVAARITARVRDGRWPMVILAPEGTCGDGRCVLRFRTGAFVPGAPVLPVLLSYESTHCNPAWTNHASVAWHFVRCGTQVRKILRVRVLPPYVPSAAEAADPALYAAGVRALYARKLGLPTVDQGFEEFAALTRLGVHVSWDGRRVVAPPGVLRPDGTLDLRAGVAGAGGGSGGSKKKD
jgi:1-acyl-sn-glycerol-3-phosphate acyltransferase